MEEKKFSKMLLSRASGIPYTTVCNFWVKGVENMKMETFKKLAKALDVSPDWLLTGEHPASHVELIRLLRDETISIDINGKPMDADFRKRMVTVISELAR